MPDELEARVQMALAQAKKVERESRMLKQMLGGIRDQYLQSQTTQGEGNGNSNTAEDD